MNTLPDYLAPGLRIVSIGLNPSLRSVEAGFYFANPRNRFWPALIASGIAPKGLAPGAQAIRALFEEHGLGFTDVVKRPSAGGAALRAARRASDARSRPTGHGSPGFTARLPTRAIFGTPKASVPASRGASRRNPPAAGSSSHPIRARPTRSSRSMISSTGTGAWHALPRQSKCDTFSPPEPGGGPPDMAGKELVVINQGGYPNG